MSGPVHLNSGSLGGSEASWQWPPIRGATCVRPIDPTETSMLLLRWLAAFPIGLLGGILFGPMFLSLGALLGRSGTTGAEYAGYWDPSLVSLGALYGGFFGMLLAPIGALLFIRKTSYRRALGPASVGTLVGGSIGAILSPPFSAVGGAAGFLIGCGVAGTRRGPVPPAA